MSELISIIVPVYNVEKYLDKCLESVVNQTYKNLEIILVDDGSTDNCPEMCDEWAKRDSRIKVLHIENQGVANARNSGIEISSAEYIMFADSDDYMETDMIEFLYNLIKKYNADISRCGLYFCYEDSGKESASSDYSVRELDNKEIISDLVTGCQAAGVVWNKLYSREIIKGHYYKKEDGCSEDIMFNYRVYKDNPKTVFCDEPKYNYVIHNNSITNNTFGYGAFDIIKAKQKIYDEYKDDESVYPYVTKGYIMSAFIVLSGCIRNNVYEDERKALRRFITEHKKEVFFSGLYSRLDKIKTLLLIVSPKLYEKMIIRSHSR